METDEEFEERPVRQSDELTLDARRLGRAARPAAQPGARAEGRSRANLDPAAGRAVPHVSGRSTRAEARDRRRLSRDGGVARLSQILPAPAQGPRGRSQPRRDRAPPADAAAAAGRDARGRRAAARPRPARTRRVRARRSRRSAPGSQGRVAGARIRPLRRLRSGEGEDPTGDARRPCARGADAGGSARAARPDDWSRCSTGPSSRASFRRRRIRSSGDRRSRPASSRCSSSRAGDALEFAQDEAFAPIKLRAA